MSRHLIIRHLGAIEHVELDIQRLNIFIGPQSSGKSTIAKCISFGLWLEKEISLHQSADHIDDSFIRQQFLVYHKLENYVTAESFVEYHCDFFTFTYSPSSSQVALSDLPPVAMGKVSYIPSERNFVTLPNIASLKMSADYMRDFLFDWLLYRSKYPSSNAFPILDLGVKYYYDKNRGDRIILNDEKEISLTEASSGLQSIIPLLASMHYCSHWLYDHDADISYERQLLLKQQLLKYLYSVDPTIDPNILLLESEHGAKVKVNVKDTSNPDAPGTLTDLQEVLKQYSSQIQRPRFTAMILEEPEQNLFPLTQYQLVKQIASAFNSHSENVFVVTTHSPYVMSSFNNLIEAYHVISRMGNSVWGNDIDRATAIDHHQIAAYSLQDGQATNIFDNEVELISAEALDSVSYQIESDFNQLLSL